MSDLQKAQVQFLLDLADLINYAHQLGMNLVLGEGWRPPILAKMYAEQGIGIVDSVHTLRLAVDLPMLAEKDGNLVKDSEAYRPLGVFWKAKRPENRWGGDFKKQDGNHFSQEWKGRM